MEWLIEIVKGLLTLAGVFVTVSFTLKGKKLELATAQDEKRAEDINKITDDFKARLNVVGIKLDDIKTEQLKIALIVSQLQKDISKSNDIVDDLVRRVTDLEKQVSVLDNRESVSEHRLTDLERSHE